MNTLCICGHDEQKHVPYCVAFMPYGCGCLSFRRAEKKFIVTKAAGKEPEITLYDFRPKIDWRERIDGQLNLLLENVLGVERGTSIDLTNALKEGVKNIIAEVEHDAADRGYEKGAERM